MSHTMNFIIVNEDGLRLKSASDLMQVAGAFQSLIVASGNRASANAKSTPALLMLGALKGTRLTIKADGIDAVAAMHAIKQMTCLSEIAI